MTAAMARMHEMQETVRQLSQGRHVYNASLSFEKLLANAQEMQQQMLSTVGKLATTSTVLEQFCEVIKSFRSLTAQ